MDQRGEMTRKGVDCARVIRYNLIPMPNGTLEGMLNNADERIKKTKWSVSLNKWKKSRIG